MSELSYSVPQRLLEKDATMEKHFYETSNKRDFKGLSGYPAENARPSTSTFYSETETGDTTYDKEFGWKVVKKQNCERHGTASGQRKNNPHPKETFMVWKFPDNQPLGDQLKLNKEELMQEICQDKIRSTYQVDYLGCKQGEKKKRNPIPILTDNKQDDPEYTLNTTVRVDYQEPSYKGNLSGNTTRYGCNGKKVSPAVGVVPTVIHRSPLMKTFYDTSYTDEFANNDNKNMSRNDKPDLNNYMKHLSLKEKSVISSMLQSVNGQTHEPVDRISSWDGPSWK